MSLSAGNFQFKKNSFSDKKQKKSLESLILEDFQAKQRVLKTLCFDPKKKIVFFNKTQINLSKQKKLFKIFEIFFSYRTRGIKRLDLLKAIYPTILTREYSQRQLNCYNHNVIKLLSRARKMVHIAFKTDAIELNWFPYNNHSRTWEFYQIAPGTLNQIFSK